MAQSSTCVGFPEFPPPMWRPPRAAESILRQVLEQCVAGAFAIAGAELWTEQRGRRAACNARHVAMYLAHVSCGLSLSHIGRLFARDRTTVAHACRRVEERRDDPAFDHAMDLLEGALRLLAQDAPSLFGPAC